MEETPKDTESRRVTRRGALPRQNGPAIRALREKDGYKQRGFARLVGLSQGGLSAIEAEKDNAEVATLNRIARQLRVPAAAIMRDSRDEELPATAAPAAEGAAA